MIFYIIGNSHTGQSFRLGKVKEAFHFTIQPMPHLFEHDIRIGILTRMLSDGCDTGKYFIDIRHIEITTESQILGTPVVSSQEGMHIRYPGFPCGRIA